MKQTMIQSMSAYENSAQWLRRLIILLLPLFLGFSWITWVIGPVYPQVAYGQSDFPPDQAVPALTAAERLTLAWRGGKAAQQERVVAHVAETVQ